MDTTQLDNSKRDTSSRETILVGLSPLKVRWNLSKHFVLLNHQLESTKIWRKNAKPKQKRIIPSVKLGGRFTKWSKQNIFRSKKLIFKCSKWMSHHQQLLISSSLRNTNIYLLKTTTFHVYFMLSEKIFFFSNERMIIPWKYNIL